MKPPWTLSSIKESMKLRNLSIKPRKQTYLVSGLHIEIAFHHGLKRWALEYMLLNVARQPWGQVFADDRGTLFKKARLAIAEKRHPNIKLLYKDLVDLYETK